MFSFFSRQKVDIQSVTIPDFGWANTRKNNTIIEWINPESSIAVSVNFFDLPPDVPTIDNVAKLRQFYRNSISAVNGGLIEVNLGEQRGKTFIKTIFKLQPQQTKGVTYLASLTFPFKTCSFVLKIQAIETAVTGMREAFIANKLLAAGQSDLLSDWAADPYDNTFTAGMLMNKAEELEYDALFPDHPLTRARQLISQIEKEIQWRRETARLPLFDQ